MEKEKLTIYNSAGEEIKLELEKYDEYAALSRCGADAPAEVELPDNIDGKPLREIRPWAFVNCRHIRRLILPDSIKEIGAGAFRDCRGLKYVKLPAELEVLRNSVFAFCYLTDTEIVWPEKLKLIEEAAFWCGGPLRLILPDSVEKIERGAFAPLGPEAVTRLGYEEAWYRIWPFDEEIEDSSGRRGRISACSIEYEGCFGIRAQLEGETREFFYPGTEGCGFRFTDEKSNERMKREYAAVKDISRLRRLWEKGCFDYSARDREKEG